MLALYSFTIFVSAFLLFLVQPMVGKMLLPLFGGAPSVWNACMVFFQATLLGGYFYTHFSTKYLGPGRQILLHVVLLFISLMTLPIFVSTELTPPIDANPVFWLLGNLIALVGLPFLLVTSSAPMLQRWFASSGHPSSEDPYFLYSASNAGSLLALISFPLAIEPLIGLYEQSWVWTAGYGLLIFLILLCARILWRRRSEIGDIHNKSITTKTDEITLRPSWRARSFWVFTSFVPSSLMLGLTVFITTDLAAIPLLWILPLTLYLLTFIIVFARKQFISHSLMIKVLPLVIIPCSPLFFISLEGMEVFVLALHLLMFFVATLFCHSELARSRPSTQHLTEFYLWMSTGGMLGGVFNALVAPLIFTQVIEYPLAMAFVFLLLPCVHSGRNKLTQRWRDFTFPLLLSVFNLMVLIGAQLHGDINPRVIFALFFATSAFTIFCFKERPVRAALAFAVLLVSMAYWGDARNGNQVYASRSFFGVKRVVENIQMGSLELYHGRTLHGSQFTNSDRRHEPLTYFHKNGPMGDVFSVVNQSGEKDNVAVIGLGTGSVASYAKKGQEFDFFEIDQGIIDIARKLNLFYYLENCQGSYKIVIGDGRLKLAEEEDQKYGLILLDAFSSDSIPVHLLTTEALDIYLKKLEPDGLLAFHISNRFLNLESLLNGLAKEYGLVCFAKQDSVAKGDESDHTHLPSHYVVMGRIGSIAENFSNYSSWRNLIAKPNLPVWTDQHSNLVGLIEL